MKKGNLFQKVERRTIINIVLLLYALITSIVTAINGGDFDVFLDAGRKLHEGQNIYAPPFVHDLQYYYSVFFAWLLIPFSRHVFAADFIWSLFSYFLLYRAFILTKQHFDFSAFSLRQYNLWVILIIFFSFHLILNNVAMIQVTFFLLWAMLESINLTWKGRNVLAGALLGFAINLKIMPVLLVPYLFYRGKFKALAVTVVVFIALLFLPALFIGYEYNRFLHSEWWGIINPSNKEHLFETMNGTHSIVALLPVYLMETTGTLKYNRNLFNLSPEAVVWIINISRLFLLALSLLYLRSLPFRQEPNRVKVFWELSFFIFLIPLVLPHQQKYAFILTVPLVSYLLYFFIATFRYAKSRGYYIAFSGFVLSMIFYSPLYGRDVIGNFLFDFAQHYRFLTFATLLLIPVSLYCNPKKLFRTMQKSESFAFGKQAASE